MAKRKRNYWEDYPEQWVAGFIYSDEGEWLFAKNDWETIVSLHGKYNKAIIHPSQESATKHALRFKSTMEAYKVFVRRYDRGEGIDNNPVFMN